MNGRRKGKLTPSEQEQVFILFINRRISLVIIFRTGGGGGGKILKLCAKDESFPHGRNRILEKKMRLRIWLIKFIRLPHTQAQSK